MIEEEQQKEFIRKELDNNPEMSQYIMDYRQKPDGYLNYMHTELEYNPITDDYESLLVPEDDNIEARKLLQARVSKSIEAKHERKRLMEEEKLKKLQAAGEEEQIEKLRGTSQNDDSAKVLETGNSKTNNEIPPDSRD